MSTVYVSEGVVTYSGAIGAEEERHAARVAAENIAGVRGIEDRRPMYRDLPSMVRTPGPLKCAPYSSPSLLPQPSPHAARSHRARIPRG